MVLFIIGVLFVPKDKVAVVVTNSTTELLMVGEEERDAIREFIGLMAHTSVTVLPFKKGRMEEIGNKLRGKVTTFEFLWVVFSDPILQKQRATVPF